MSISSSSKQSGAKYPILPLFKQMNNPPNISSPITTSLNGNRLFLVTKFTSPAPYNLIQLSMTIPPVFSRIAASRLSLFILYLAFNASFAISLHGKLLLFWMTFLYHQVFSETYYPLYFYRCIMFSKHAGLLLHEDIRYVVCTVHCFFV